MLQNCHWTLENYFAKEFVPIYTSTSNTEDFLLFHTLINKYSPRQVQPARSGENVGLEHRPSRSIRETRDIYALRPLVNRAYQFILLICRSLWSHERKIWKKM